MKKVYTDDEISALEIPDGDNEIKANPHQEESSWMKAKKVAGDFKDAAIEDAPNLGMMAGGTLGTIHAGPAGGMAGAALGSAFGSGVKRYLHPDSQTDLEHLGDTASRSAEAAALEGALPLAEKVISPARKAVHGFLKDKAERLAYRGLGPFKKHTDMNHDNFKEVGRTALDHGVIRLRPTNAEGLEERAVNALHESGENLGRILDELLSLEKQATKSGVDRKAIADQMRAKLVSKSSIPTIQRKNAFFDNLIQEFEEGKGFTFADLRNEKQNIKQEINWNRKRDADIPALEAFHRELYTAIKNAEEDGALAIEKAFNEGESFKFEPAKKQYGHLKDIVKITGDRADAQRANQILGLKSSIAGTGAAAVGAVKNGAQGAAVYGTAGAIGNHLAKTYGSQFSAAVLNKAAKLIEQSPSLLNTSKKYPEFIPYLLQSIQDKQIP